MGEEEGNRVWEHRPMACKVRNGVCALFLAVSGKMTGKGTNSTRGSEGMEVREGGEDGLQMRESRKRKKKERWRR